MRRRILNIAMSLVILVSGVVLSSSFSSAKPDYMKKEKKACTYCHNAPNKSGLNEIGKCYAEHAHSLEQCDPKKKVSAKH